MAAEGVVRVDGLRELRRAFKLAGGPELVDQMKAANRQIGEMVISAAKPAMPTLTGEMAGTMRASNTSWSAKVRMGSARRGRYAPIIHWGSKYRPQNAPRPVIAATAQRMSGRIADTYIGAVNRILRTISDQ